MRKLRTVLVVILALAAAVALASFGGETVVASDGGVRMTGGLGPQSIDLLADGTATVYLVKGSSAATAAIYYFANGDSVFNLRSGIPRHMYLSGSSVDSVYVVLGTATEVILTW